jgi:CopG-like RHH_1 or ribbon-helix-helix domain, RHH_5
MPTKPNKADSVRFTVSLPKPVADDLKRWAESEGRMQGSLAAFLLEYAVRLRYSERYPPQPSEYPPKVTPPGEKHKTPLGQQI